MLIAALGRFPQFPFTAVRSRCWIGEFSGVGHRCHIDETTAGVLSDRRQFSQVECERRPRSSWPHRAPPPVIWNRFPRLENEHNHSIARKSKPVSFRETRRLWLVCAIQWENSGGGTPAGSDPKQHFPSTIQHWTLSSKWSAMYGREVRCWNGEPEPMNVTMCHFRVGPMVGL